jgi:hypothetical protein
MKTSEQINEIAGALAKAQSAMRNAPLNKINPHFRSKYADLAGIRDATTPALAANGIALVQTLDTTEAGSVVLTRLVHTSGQWIESACAIPTVPDMQKLGSAITYARRYSLSAICGIAADEDDDGNAAAEGNGQSQKQSAPAGPKPDGYDAWFESLQDVVPEGQDALKKAWTSARPDLRQYLTKHHPELWEKLKAKADIKAKADKVKAPAHA